jgi:ribosomal protein S18 acetylase RimI-like enzyme
VSGVVVSDIVHAIEQNLFNYLLEFAKVREGQIVHSDLVKATYTGTPLLNRVFDASFSSIDDIKLTQILQPFQDWNVPLTWMTGPSTQPDALGEWLLNQGFNQLSTWTGMALRVSALPNIHLPENFSFRTVKNREDLALWTDIARPTFGLPAQHHDLFQNLFSQLLVEPNAPFEGFLACMDDQPVGTCFLFEQGNAIGIYWVATALQAQHQGIATMLTYAALSGKPDATLAVLHATPPGRGVYEKMGFKSYCEFGLYGWNPAK